MYEHDASFAFDLLTQGSIQILDLPLQGFHGSHDFKRQIVIELLLGAECVVFGFIHMSWPRGIGENLVGGLEHENGVGEGKTPAYGGGASFDVPTMFPSINCECQL
jgi:hypothetical protein